MSSGRGRSPCDTGPRELRLDVICPGTWPLPRDGTTDIRALQLRVAEPNVRPMIRVHDFAGSVLNRRVDDQRARTRHVPPLKPKCTVAIACYHDVMARKPTTVRIPEELADTAEVVARARGVSVNALILEALQHEVDRVKKDKQFMALLRSHVERDKEILDRLAE